MGVLVFVCWFLLVFSAVFESIGWWPFFASERTALSCLILVFAKHVQSSLLGFGWNSFVRASQFLKVLNLFEATGCP